MPDDHLDELEPALDEDGWIPGAADPPPRPLVYATVEAFVTQYLAPHICRRLGGSATWCPWWWRHTEAISRLAALWTAWEHLRTEGALGMSQWWLYHADPHLAVLMSKDSGPFASCKPDRHTDITPLPCHPAPPGLWAGEAFSDPAPESNRRIGEHDQAPNGMLAGMGETAIPDDEGDMQVLRVDDGIEYTADGQFLVDGHEVEPGRYTLLLGDGQAVLHIADPDDL